MNKSHITDIKMFWDCEFHYRLLLGIIEANSNIDGVSTFLASLILRECTVFVQEMAIYNHDIEKAIAENSSQLFQTTYPIIRDRIHYFSSRPFDYEIEKSAAENMMRNIQAYYFTRPVDDMNPLRYDVSYIKAQNFLYYSSVDMSALLEDTPIAKNGKIVGPALQQYSSDLAKIIANVRSGFAETELGQIVKLDALHINNETIELAFFDGKFDMAVVRTEFSEYLTIILLRLLGDIGSLLYTIRFLFNGKWSNSYHLYFFTRLIAIRFDEISDAIYKIENSFPLEESRIFLQQLKSSNIYPFPEQLRLVAKRLRNSIHYNASGEIWNLPSSKSFSWSDNFLKQANIKAYPVTNWPDDYLELCEKMITHLTALQKWLADIFDYELNPVKLD